MTAKLKILFSIIFAVICSVAACAFAACGGLVPDGGDDGNGGDGDCEHSLVHYDAVAPSCEEEGNLEY